jgi:cytochrome oxidase assembly protein ShyY1
MTPNHQRSDGIMIGNIILAAVILLALGLAAWKIVKDRWKGAGCGCGHCADRDECHKK